MNRIFDPEEPIDLPYETETTDSAITDPQAVPAETARQAAAAATPAGTERRSPAPDHPTPSQERPVQTAAAAAAPRRTPAQSRSRQAARPAASSLRSKEGARRRPDDRILLISALAGVCMVSVAGSLVYFGTWNRLQQSLSQERNLLLVERLRNLGPANPTPIQAPEASATAPQNGTASAAADGSGLPPPPDEPWIQQLSSLPSPTQSSAPVLRVPLSPRLNAPAPAASESRATPPRSTGPLPQLVGVVGGQGRASSAIFLMGGNSMNVGPGESIGGSGWRLRSADGETALIERDGELRQVSIANANGF